MNFRALILYFFKKISGLASLGMNIILLSHSSGLTLLIISFIFHLLMCILLHYIDSSHNLSCLQRLKESIFAYITTQKMSGN